MIGEESYLQYHHVNCLHYMNMVIKETMRLYPTAASTFRKLNRRCDIAGYSVPAETTCMVRIPMFIILRYNFYSLEINRFVKVIFLCSITNH